jgi:hypothetical protein
MAIVTASGGSKRLKVTEFSSFSPWRCWRDAIALAQAKTGKV